MANDAYGPIAVKVDPSFKAKVDELEAGILAQEGDPVEFEYNHYFTPGIYTRQMILPAGTTATGHIHKRSSTNIISRGHVHVVTDEGEYDIHGPYTFISGPGVRKVLHCVTEVEWTAVYPWDGETTDFNELYDQHLVGSYEALDLIEGPK